MTSEVAHTRDAVVTVDRLRFPEPRRAAAPPALPLLAVPIANARTMRPQSSSIVTESFVTPIHVSNTFETIQRKILRQANGSGLFLWKNAYAKFTLIDMPLLSHELASVRCERIKRTLAFAQDSGGS